MSVSQDRRRSPAASQVAARGSSEIADLRFEVAGLRRALATQAPIEQAKGMLMMRFGIADDDAIALLARWSSHHNIKVRRVASTLINRLTRDSTLIDLDESPDAFLTRVLNRS